MATSALLNVSVSAADLDDCTELRALDRTVAGCSALIATHWGDRRTRAMLFNNRAVALSLLGLDDDARSDHDQAITFDPSYADARYNLAHFLARRGDDRNALKDLRKAAAQDPPHPEAAQALQRLSRRN